jgi:hypothetical protein
MTQTAQQKSKEFDAKWIVKTLYWLTLTAALWFAYLNVQPYAIAVKKVMLEVLPDPALIKLIAAIPIVNGIVAFIGIAVHWFVGFILWLIIQTVEVLPIILRRDRAFVRTLIQESEKQAQFQINDNDDPALKALKRWYNQFPALTINRARIAALFVYAIDFLICIAVYPPCKGGFGQLIFILATGQFNRLDWANIALLFITLFVIEILVRFLLWLGQVAYFMKAAHSSQ